jgi:hypothetical protein
VYPVSGSPGDIRDIRKFFRRLRLQKVNNLDDGTVIDHRNLEDLKKPSS